MAELVCRVVGSQGVYPTTSVISSGISPFYGGLVFGVRPFSSYRGSGQFPQPWLSVTMLSAELEHGKLLLPKLGVQKVAK